MKMNMSDKIMKSPKRLKRSESFLGIHFDFHAMESDQNIGLNTTPEMIEEILDAVKPDYLQCDCKGHPGYSSYPTKAGNSAPGVKKDALRIWREVTGRYGVSLYMHYSGVWDTKAIKDHPSWARIDENGEMDPNNVSVFGPYVDELLIPQLKELRDEYGVDGVWIDGDCWATCPDYTPSVLEAFRQETGITEIPRKPSDPYFFEFNQFCREGFRQYLKHYVNALHQHDSNFEIASNWSFSSFMPEPVTIDVDFLSGDFSLQNSINSARLEARCLTRQGKPWDLMAWAFSKKFGESCNNTKSVVQLCQEAAVVLSLGGGFQAYFKQKGDGSVATWSMRLMHEAAKFCRARQKFCHRAVAIPQIALLQSTEAFYRKTARVFGAWGGELIPLQGILQALLNSQNALEILSEHHLTGHMQEYPLIIVPEWEYLDRDFREELLTYVRQGGNLLIIGPKAARLFEKELCIEFEGEFQEEAVFWIEHNGWLASLKTLLGNVVLKEGAQEFGKLYKDDDIHSPIGTAASITPFGRGKIAATYFNFGERYIHGTTTTARDFLNAIVRELFPNPLVEVEGSHFVDVTVNRIDGKLAVNLVNTSGDHADMKVYVYDEIPALGPLSIKIRYGKKPGKVVLEPEGKTLEYTYDKGVIRTALDRLEIHSILVIE